jgi:hypothetical protein
MQEDQLDARKGVLPYCHLARAIFLIDSRTKENLEKDFGEVSERAGDIEWRDLCE